METRYVRNFSSINEDDQSLIRKKTVLVVGNGGLGGYLLDLLSRLGVKKIKLVDFDIFEVTNLNRQLISNEENIGLSKVQESKKYINRINSTIEVETFSNYFEESDFDTLFKEVDVVFDCCDNIKTKFNIEQQCKKYTVPMIYGAVGGFFGQISCILPENNPQLYKIYPKIKNDDIVGIEFKEGNLCSTVATTASLQVSLFIKLIKKEEIKINGFYYIDLDSFEIQWISFQM